MSYDCKQFRSLIKRILSDVEEGLSSDAAVNLLLGTAAQESRFGTFLRQVKGPALGAFQVEPVTFVWLRDKFAAKYPHELAHTVAEMLEWNLALSILIARLRYRVVPAPLPAADDVHALAAYWKAYYNTPAGAGTVEEFVKNYRKYVRA